MNTLKNLFPYFVLIAEVVLVLLGAYVGYLYTSTLLGGLLAAFVVSVVVVATLSLMARASVELKAAAFALGLVALCVYFGWLILQWIYNAVLLPIYHAYIAWVAGLLVLNPASVGFAIILAVILLFALVVTFARIVHGR